jgi:GntR family transcriptional repressor for pyruvate dehydrogenase complex
MRHKLPARSRGERQRATPAAADAGWRQRCSQAPSHGIRVLNSGTVSPPVGRVQNTSERVFADLLEAVVAGRYAPGEKLPRQRELAADLGVTLQPLREALKRLEQIGVVEARHGDATRVRDWRAHGTLDVLAHLGPAVLGDLLEARSLMLREMAGLAAERRDEPRARAIAALAERFAHLQAGAGGLAADLRAAAELDFAFFTEVAEAAGNLVFLLILNGIRGVYFEHLDELPVAADVAGLAPAYAALADAIGDGDADAARDAAFALAEAQRRAVTG